MVVAAGPVGMVVTAEREVAGVMAVVGRVSVVSGGEGTAAVGVGGGEMAAVANARAAAVTQEAVDRAGAERETVDLATVDRPGAERLVVETEREVSTSRAADGQEVSTAVEPTAADGQEGPRAADGQEVTLVSLQAATGGNRSR